MGREVVCLREPGGTDVGEQLRGVVLSPKNVNMCDASELLIYEAARAQLVSEVDTCRRFRAARWCCATALPTPPWLIRLAVAGLTARSWTQRTRSPAKAWCPIAPSCWCPAAARPTALRAPRAARVPTAWSAPARTSTLA